MSVVEERNKWREAMRRGDNKPSIILEDYRKNRDSDLWRASRAVEYLCELILFYEENINAFKN